MIRMMLAIAGESVKRGALECGSLLSLLKDGRFLARRSSSSRVEKQFQATALENLHISRREEHSQQRRGEKRGDHHHQRHGAEHVPFR